MSIQDTKAFFNAIITDDNFRSQLQGPKTDEERAVAIRAAGYNFTPEESQELLNQITEAAAISNGLSDAELEAVSGGALGAITGPGALVSGGIGAGAGALGGLVGGLVKGDSARNIAGDTVGGAVAGGVGGAQGPA